MVYYERQILSQPHWKIPLRRAYSYYTGVPITCVCSNIAIKPHTYGLTNVHFTMLYFEI